MNPYLAKLRNLEKGRPEAPSKLTKPGFDGFVGEGGVSVFLRLERREIPPATESRLQKTRPRRTLKTDKTPFVLHSRRLSRLAPSMSRKSAGEMPSPMLAGSSLNGASRPSRLDGRPTTCSALRQFLIGPNRASSA